MNLQSELSVFDRFNPNRPNYVTAAELDTRIQCEGGRGRWENLCNGCSFHIAPDQPDKCPRCVGGRRQGKYVAPKGIDDLIAEHAKAMPNIRNVSAGKKAGRDSAAKKAKP